MSFIEHSKSILADHSQPIKYRYDAAAYIARTLREQGRWKANDIYQLAQQGKLDVYKLEQLISEFASIEKTLDRKESTQ